MTAKKKLMFTGSDTEGGITSGYQMNDGMKPCFYTNKIMKHIWRKHPLNPVLPSTGCGNTAPFVIEMNDNTYRMYYHMDIADGFVGIGFATANKSTPWKWISYKNNPVFKPTGKDTFDGLMVRYPRVARFTEKHWFLYYTGTPLSGSSRQKLFFAAGMAESFDGGITWRRVPDFYLPQGDKKFRYSYEGTVGQFVMPPSASKRSGLSSPWNMWYTAFERQPYPMFVGICYATSSDGKKWKPYSGNPVLRAQDPFKGKRLLLKKIRNKLKIATGSEAWEIHKKWSRVWCLPWVICENGVFRMWHTKWGVGNRTYRICYAQSNNGISWKTDPDDFELDVSAKGWDSDMTEYPCVLGDKNKWRMWYSGNKFSGIGYATAGVEKI